MKTKIISILIILTIFIGSGALIFGQDINYAEKSLLDTCWVLQRDSKDTSTRLCFYINSNDELEYAYGPFDGFNILSGKWEASYNFITLFKTGGFFYIGSYYIKDGYLYFTQAKDYVFRKEEE
jgi:hypothetical protein